MAKVDIQIIVPEVSDDEISDGLRDLTEAIDTAGGDISAGFLGGEYGYGGRWDSAVFMMHPYCWCEQDSCPWCAGCGCVPKTESYVDGQLVEDWHAATEGTIPPLPSEVAKYGTPEYVQAQRLFEAAIDARNARIRFIYPEIRHTCGRDWAINQPRRTEFGPSQSAPNFWHKPSGVKVWWYKYIGRSMEVEYPVNRAWADILADCVADVRKTPQL